MKINLLHYTPLYVCARAIRTCWDSHSKSDNGGDIDKDLIHRIGNVNKHKSTLEHLVYSFEIIGISRACLQELARHRIASLSVKSTRYTLKELNKEESFFCDIEITDDNDSFSNERFFNKNICEANHEKTCRDKFSKENICEANLVSNENICETNRDKFFNENGFSNENICNTNHETFSNKNIYEIINRDRFSNENIYKLVNRAKKYIVFNDLNDLRHIKRQLDTLENLRLSIQEGIPNDKAKYVLPESYKTSLVWTINGRSLQNFLSLRTDKRALKEIRDLGLQIFLNLPKEHKYLYEGFVKRNDNL